MWKITILLLANILLAVGCGDNQDGKVQACKDGLQKLYDCDEDGTLTADWLKAGQEMCEDVRSINLELAMCLLQMECGTLTCCEWRHASYSKVENDDRTCKLSACSDTGFTYDCATQEYSWDNYHSCPNGQTSETTISYDNGHRVRCSYDCSGGSGSCCDDTSAFCSW